jgi:predicted CXXCH cytochrome family protein
MVNDQGYASSAACQTCHPQQYASWHASFHRRMTQVATTEAVLAPFAGEEFAVASSTVRLIRRHGNFWVEKRSGPAGKADARPIVMTTGSHHMQGYWVRRDESNLLDQLPLMWLIEPDGGGRWVPLGDSFLAPPHDNTERTPWNQNCVFCHAVAGIPGVEPRVRRFDTTVAELGIACEACHGPAERHLAAHSRPPDGDATNDRADPTIVHPKRLESDRSAQVCGQCHAVAKFTTDRLLQEWPTRGSPYRPGDDLEATRLTLSPSRLTSAQVESLRKGTGGFWESHFWPDGMVRVAGREYNGLVESACHEKGNMSCLDCHSIHQSNPDDQLAEGMETNEACFQCHASYRNELARHTHHRAESSGSQCYNCHMPHTTYGLFKAIRSHQITNPNVATTLDTGRPNACNLCHLDQTLAWSAEKLSEWYGQPAVELDDDTQNVSAALLWLLRGDAVQRALVAWSGGWQPAREASSSDDWLPPFLELLLKDRYAAVRLVADRSLKKLGYDLGYDFLAPKTAPATEQAQALERMRRAKLDVTGRSALAGRLLLDAEGRLRWADVERLLNARDDHDLWIDE